MTSLGRSASGPAGEIGAVEVMGACQAVVSEAGPDRVYCGFGSSFAVLDPTISPPTLVTTLNDNPTHLRREEWCAAVRVKVGY